MPDSWLRKPSCPDEGQLCPDLLLVAESQGGEPTEVKFLLTVTFLLLSWRNSLAVVKGARNIEHAYINFGTSMIFGDLRNFRWCRGSSLRAWLQQCALLLGEDHVGDVQPARRPRGDSTLLAFIFRDGQQAS